MKIHHILACFAAATQSVLGQTVDQDYLDSICSPNVTLSAGATLPPCISVINIQGQCAPNNTSPLDYEAMSQCLCNAPSTFFQDWLGCRQCLEYHGGLSQQALARYSVVITSVSNAVCTGTPTAVFADYYTNIAGAVGAVSTGATGTSDQSPSQTAVSLYYTPSGVQGPGAITGSATAATKSGDSSVAPSTGAVSSKATTNAGSASTTSGSASTTSGTGNGSSASASATSTATSSGGAMATSGYGLGMVLAVVGGAIVAPL